AAVVAVRVRRVVLVAPVAVRVRRSPAASVRISPTVRARTPRASSAPAAVAAALMVASDAWVFLASMTRPALAAASRASASWVAVSGWLELMSQPDCICLQWRRCRPVQVMNEVGSEGEPGAWIRWRWVALAEGGLVIRASGPAWMVRKSVGGLIAAGLIPR